MNVTHRTTHGSSAQVELRAAAGSELPELTGYAILWNAASETIREQGMVFVERFARGSVSRSLKVDDQVALVGHDPNKPLGRRSAGTLQLSEDATGLRFVIVPPDTSYARDLIESVRRGDVLGMSFGFTDVRDKWTKRPDGSLLREVVEARLIEISATPFPAYPVTSVSVARDMQPAASDLALLATKLRIMEVEIEN